MKRKEKKEKKLKRVASELATLEKQCQDGINVQENMSKMARMIEEFSLEELLMLDEYILQNNLLTK